MLCCATGIYNVESMLVYGNSLMLVGVVNSLTLV